MGREQLGMKISTPLALEAVGIRWNVWCITRLTQSNWVCEVPVLVVPIHRPAKHTTLSSPRFGHNIGHSFVCHKQKRASKIATPGYYYTALH
jgi:hypothetical protein